MRVNLSSVILLSLLSGMSNAATVEATQKDKAFIPSTLKIKQGDTVKFINQDPFFHNVFSLSDTKLFDLGSYPQGDSRDVKFDQKGVVAVECAIHSNMTMTITVE